MAFKSGDTISVSTYPRTDSFNTDSMLHVSLTGNMGPSVAAAPKPSTAPARCSTQPSGIPLRSAATTDHQPPEQLAKLFEVIRAVAVAETRTDAVQTLTQEISRRFPDSTVRCGLGDSKLRRLYDQRLGWLAPESGPREQAAKQWPDLADRPAGVFRKDSAIVLCLPQGDSSQQCVVWVHPVAAKDVFSQWLQTVAGTVAMVFWSRPNRVAPKAIRNLTRRTLAVAGVVVLAFSLLAFWPVHYRVACLARVQPLEQRLVAAPFEAVLLSAVVKPGQTVRVGEVLASLDGRPLRLEREAIESEIQQVCKEHDTALATGRIADAQQAKLRERQLSRTFELISDRLNRLDVVSPIDGVVISGELKQYVGAPLELGQTLFEISPMQKVAIEVEIPAHEIGYVKTHAATRVRFAAIGGPSMQLELDDLYPSAEIRDDENVFIGRIEVDNEDGKLRPGMQGDATTFGPVRPWIWSWVRGKVERVLWWIGY
ncbi:efflux RND transporter periplasmic adaptor subunit [Novipirellula artificiosorum]|uniref:CusB-like beta-barrel domain-containing protein n=1 Tax=Novipirellula artificiosorum TaxID=2528016 RepID=A0A5C6E1J8_9BACT|nr:efflux RND transporter periplasmic adaptor subunit [Novipirellula artificiosorum]TWU41009.1 hypothetical protein Poly41_18440 [Novipirellula artificiosorum]